MDLLPVTAAFALRGRVSASESKMRLCGNSSTLRAHIVGRQQCFHKQLMPKQGFSCKHSIDKLNTSHNSLPFLDIDCTETKHADLSLSSNEALPVSLLGQAEQQVSERSA